MPKTASASVRPLTCATPQSSRVIVTRAARDSHRARSICRGPASLACAQVQSATPAAITAADKRSLRENTWVRQECDHLLNRPIEASRRSAAIATIDTGLCKARGGTISENSSTTVKSRLMVLMGIAAAGLILLPAVLVGDVAASARGQALMLAAGIGLASLGALIFVALQTAHWLEETLGGEPAEVAEIARKVAAGTLSGNITRRSGDTSSLLAAAWRKPRQVAT